MNKIEMPPVVFFSFEGLHGKRIKTIAMCFGVILEEDERQLPQYFWREICVN
jgi:hypothetical protein